MAKASQHAGVGVGVGALPDDLLRDIFARVPDKANLLRFAGVCRRWLRLIAKSAFLRRAGFSPEDARRRSFLVGAFYQNSALYSSPERMGNVSLFPPELERLYPTPPGGWPFEFFAPNYDGLYNYAKPLASRRGLLLLRILPTPLDWRKLHLLVCHPLIGGDQGTRLVPPPRLDFDPGLYGADLTSYAILTDADRRTCGDDRQDHEQQRSAFKVLFSAQHSDDKLVYAHSYSSATGNWSAPIKCPQVSGLTMSGPRAGVVARGTAYWLYRDEAHFYALGVSADVTEVSLIKLPIQVDHDTLRLQPPFPCIAGGKLSFAVLDRRNSGMLNLWSTKHDEDEDDHGGSEGLNRWTHSNLMSIDAIRIKIFAFAESRGAILVSDGYSLFTLDLDNKKMEPVTCARYAKEVCPRYMDKCDGHYSCVECTYNSRVLYEMDWSSYILHLSATRLGGTMR